MHNKKELCEKIVSLYPDIGRCGIEVDVEFDQPKNAWAVHLHKQGQDLTHYIDIPEADSCLDGRQCVSLGLEIAQLKKNVEGRGF